LHPIWLQNNQNTQDLSIPVNRYRKQDRWPNSRFKDHYLFSIEPHYPNVNFEMEPRTFREAIAHLGWAHAIMQEVESVFKMIHGSF
jgi:hypothetical protein